MSNMSGIDAAAAAEAYKGHAQIIQGVLIAMSAVIAVIGYYVQSKLQRQEKLRQVELDHKTKLLTELVGPAQGLSYMGLWARVNFIQHVCYPGVFSPVRPDETSSELWFFGAGEDGKKCKELVFEGQLHRFYKFILKSIECPSRF